MPTVCHSLRELWSCLGGGEDHNIMMNSLFTECPLHSRTIRDHLDHLIESSCSHLTEGEIALNLLGRGGQRKECCF